MRTFSLLCPLGIADNQTLYCVLVFSILCEHLQNGEQRLVRVRSIDAILNFADGLSSRVEVTLIVRRLRRIGLGLGGGDLGGVRFGVPPYSVCNESNFSVDADFASLGSAAGRFLLLRNLFPVWKGGSRSGFTLAPHSDFGSVYSRVSSFEQADSSVPAMMKVSRRAPLLSPSEERIKGLLAILPASVTDKHSNVQPL